MRECTGNYPRLFIFGSACVFLLAEHCMGFPRTCDTICKNCWVDAIHNIINERHYNFFKDFLITGWIIEYSVKLKYMLFSIRMIDNTKCLLIYEFDTFFGGSNSYLIFIEGSATWINSKRFSWGHSSNISVRNIILIMILISKSYAVGQIMCQLIYRLRVFVFSPLERFLKTKLQFEHLDL